MKLQATHSICSASSTRRHRSTADVVEELRAGRKRSHWMWFVFPQLLGLGGSPMAVRYGISSLDEAGAYLGHELLGPRLHECTRLVNQVQGRSIGEIFGSPDDLKLCSSMTLFAACRPTTTRTSSQLLDKYYDGRQDRTDAGAAALGAACSIRQPCGSTTTASTTSCGGADDPASTSARSTPRLR